MRRIGKALVVCAGMSCLCSFGQSRVYIATGRGIFFSDERGAGWQKIADLGDRRVLSLVIQPDDRNKMFAATTDGLFRSLDAGTSWEVTNLPGPALKPAVIRVHPKGPERVFAIAQAQ